MQQIQTTTTLQWTESYRCAENVIIWIHSHFVVLQLVENALHIPQQLPNTNLKIILKKKKNEQCPCLCKHRMKSFTRLKLQYNTQRAPLPPSHRWKKNPLQQKVTVLDLLQHGNRTSSINSCDIHTLQLLCVLIWTQNQHLISFNHLGFYLIQ